MGRWVRPDIQILSLSKKGGIVLLTGITRNFYPLFPLLLPLLLLFFLFLCLSPMLCVKQGWNIVNWRDEFFDSRKIGLGFENKTRLREKRERERKGRNRERLPRVRLLFLKIETVWLLFTSRERMCFKLLVLSHSLSLFLSLSFSLFHPRLF